MSLFDVIKYSSIDLTDLKDLQALPPVILRKYWLLASNNSGIVIANKSASRILAYWAKLDYKTAHRHFTTALKEYNESV